jgi:antitoxin ParD1/3/4
MSIFAIKESLMTLNVSLPIKLEARVRAHVASGLYGSASEVIREALRVFEVYQSVQKSSLVALKADIDQGMADGQAGRVSKMDMTAIKAQGRALKKRA